MCYSADLSWRSFLFHSGKFVSVVPSNIGYSPYLWPLSLGHPSTRYQHFCFHPPLLGTFFLFPVSHRQDKDLHLFYGHVVLILMHWPFRWAAPGITGLLPSLRSGCVSSGRRQGRCRLCIRVAATTTITMLKYRHHTRLPHRCVRATPSSIPNPGDQEDLDLSLHECHVSGISLRSPFNDCPLDSRHLP